MQRNVTIPDSAFSGGKGSYTMKLQLAKERRFVLTMSDSTGFAAGGTTEVMLVGASSGASCDTADPGMCSTLCGENKLKRIHTVVAIAFPFQLNSALQQCRAFAFTGYQSAVQPVTIWVRRELLLRTLCFAELISLDGGARWDITNRSSWCWVVI